MTFYYFDTETTSADVAKAKLITIQYRRLGECDVAPSGPLVILKRWEMSERRMLLAFAPLFTLWNFVPVGQSLLYDYIVLAKRIEAHQLWGEFQSKSLEEILRRPDFDAKYFMVRDNGYVFKGHDKVAGGPVGGSKKAARLIAEKRWNDLERYIIAEHRGLLKYLRSI